MTEYNLRTNVLGNVPEISIDEKSYQALRHARNVLINGFAIEEKYEILISNYLEFEKRILSATAECMVRAPVEYSDFFEVRLDLNIRLVNLLTSARLYVDRLGRDVRGCLPERGDIETTVKSLLSAECDAHLEYRFMEALRNHVQHYGLPIHWASSGARWTSLEPDGLMEYSINIAAERKRLTEDGKFKRKILEELPDRNDLKAALRRYMECLGNIHAGVRKLIGQSLEQARKTIEEAHLQYSRLYSGSLVGLSAFMWDAVKCLETVPLLLEWDDIRIRLKKRNGSLVNLRKRYVTGRVVP
jgi:hypothetical protein